MKLAKIILQTNELGSTITLPYVSPPELMLLVADNHKAAKRNPILKLTEVLPSEQEEKIADLKIKLSEVEDKLQSLDKEKIVEELRVQRANTYQYRINSLKDQIQFYQNILNRRSAPPSREREYLMSKYQQKEVRKLFPSAIPTFPETFEEAQQLGMGSEDLMGGQLATFGS